MTRAFSGIRAQDADGDGCAALRMGDLDARRPIFPSLDLVLYESTRGFGGSE
jgi:hypothetical protein